MEKHPNAHKPSAEERKRDIREEVTDADATGLVAGEELITEAETILPLLQRRPESDRGRT